MDNRTNQRKNGLIKNIRKLNDMEDPELTDFLQLLSYRDAITPENQRVAFTEVIEYEFTKTK